jgi:hypothetical protein
MLSKKEAFLQCASEMGAATSHPMLQVEDGDRDLEWTDAIFVTKQMMRGVGRVADRGFEGRVF